MFRIVLFFSLVALPAWAKKTCRDVDSESSGTITSTIYYTPVLLPETVSCGDNRLHVWVNYKGEHIRDCERIQSELSMQGAATIVDAQGSAKTVLLWNGGGKFKKVSAQDCPAGYGRHGVCLNPFRTLAAHSASGYKTGDVIFIPHTEGMKYPEFPGQEEVQWATHDGYWIVGDSGGAIRGKGRFDFFSGFMHYRKARNPLSRLGLGKSTGLVYCKIKDSTAAQVRAAQDFPDLPERIRRLLLTAHLAGFLP